MERTVRKEVNKLFITKYNCAQTVLTLITKHMQLFSSSLPYLAAGLGGGVGGQGEVCGAITGATLAIGLLLSQRIKDVSEHKDLTKTFTREFLKRMKRTFNTIKCNKLLNFDIRDEALHKKNIHVFTEICPKVISKAVVIVLELFSE